MDVKKFFSYTVLFMALFLTCGCNKNAPLLLFNNQEINTVTIKSPVTIFELGETVHYVILNPKGFTSPYLRIQLIKKETKTQNWGFKIYTSKNVKIDTTKKFYIDSLKLYKSGSYIMSVYYLDDLQRPIVRATFVVK